MNPLAIFALPLLLRWKKARELADATLDALSVSYANTGYIGIPLCILVLGQDSLTRQMRLPYAPDYL